MTFKKLILPLLVVSLSGCSEFLKGEPAKETAIEIKQESISCLKEVSLEISKFLKSESTDADIEKTFNCIDSTLTQFQTRVEGREDAEAFNADELYQIFDKFIKDSKISKAAVLDILALKAALLGGSDQRLTKTEIKSLRDFLLAVKTEVKNLLPFAQLFSFAKGERAFPKTMITNGFAQLNLSVKNLLKASKITRANYRYEDFKQMLVSLNLIDGAQHGVLALADKVNDLILGGASLVTEVDRELYIDNLTEVLRLYSLENQGFVKFEISSPEVMENTLEYFGDVLNFLENSVQYKKTKMIAVETLDPLVTEIQRKEILPVRLSLETALGFYKTILVRVFETGLNAEIKAFKGVERIHFANLRRELAIYKIFNRRIIQGPAVEFDFAAQDDILREFSTAARTEVLRICDELKIEFSGATAPPYSRNKIILGASASGREQSWQDFSRSFYVIMMARELVAGWGGKGSISEQGIVQWYSEFKAFGLESRAFDPRVGNAGLANLRAANLFTRSGNGDNKMDFRETIEQLGILFTSGGAAFREMTDGFEKARCQLNETDVFNFKWNNESCVKNELRKNADTYFSNLPNLLQYMNRLSDAQFNEFVSALLDVARTDAANREARLESSDLKSMTLLFHYMESLFAAFDKDRNQSLSAVEIKESYPRFKVYAEAYAHKNAQATLDLFNKWLGEKTGYGCYNEGDLIKEGFVYLVLNSKSAGLTDLNLAPCVISHRPLMNLEGEADRRKMINTFKILKAVLGS